MARFRCPTRDQFDNMRTVEPACFARRKPRGAMRAAIAIAAAFWCGGAALMPAQADEVTRTSTKPIPDFSGIWGRWLHFEQPVSGPGPIVNTTRSAAGTMD